MLFFNLMACQPVPAMLRIRSGRIRKSAITFVNTVCTLCFAFVYSVYTVLTFFIYRKQTLPKLRCINKHGTT